jgi:hypothetical protein
VHKPLDRRVLVRNAFMSAYLILERGERIMKKMIIFSVCLFVIILSTASFASAATPPYPFNGKGAAFQYVISGHIINAYITMSDSGKDGKMYVSIQHPRGVSAAQGNVEFKWNMNHITAEAMDMNFILTGDTTSATTGAATGFGGKHNVTITWNAEGGAIMGQSNINTGHGFILSINGQYKTAQAALDLYDLNALGHTHLGPYVANWSTVFQGSGQIYLTMPST